MSKSILPPARVAARVDVSAIAAARAELGDRAMFAGHWDVVCRGPDGRVKWRDTIENLITNEGLNHILDVELSGATQVTTWYIGLTDGTPTVAAGDTMSSHAGWAEVTAYDESVRETFVEPGPSSQSITNSASPAQFTIDTNSTTVGGGFLTSVNTKGGTTGVLFSVGAFTAGDKSLDDNDTIDVTLTISAADS